MPRPRSRRCLSRKPEVTYYKPQGIPLKNLEVMEITHEEWEALRLKNVEKLSQTDAAKKMETSQSTFQRILTAAHQKMSLAMVQGMAIKIVK